MRILVIAAGAALASVLTGCQTFGGVQIPEKVSVSTPVACIDPADVPTRPELRPDDELLALDDYRFPHAVWAAYQRVKAYANELEPIAQGCSKIPPATPPP